MLKRLRPNALIAACFCLTAMAGCANKERIIEDQAISWVQQCPEWIFGGLSERQTISYEEWIQKGRQIKGIESAVRGLLRDNDGRVLPAAAARCLGLLGDSRSVPVLIKALSHDDGSTRLEAAIALGTLKDNRAVPALCERLYSDGSLNVRVNAAVALGRIGDPQAIWPLKDASRSANSFVEALRYAIDEIEKAQDR